MNGPQQATQADAIAELVTRSKRAGGVPLRKTFLQQGTRSNIVPGPLHHIVRHHDRHGLDLYLLVQLVAAGPPHKVLIDAGGWARALGLQRASGRATVSRTWKRLTELQLIARGR